jgi:hypothetical protein
VVADGGGERAGRRLAEPVPHHVAGEVAVILPGGSVENFDVQRLSSLKGACSTTKGWEFFSPQPSPFHTTSRAKSRSSA